MNKLLLVATAMTVIVTGVCRANIIDERELHDIYSKSNAVVYGVVKSSTPAKCGGKNETSALYVLRVRETIKGDFRTGEVKVCVQQLGMLLSKSYIVAGDRYGRNEIVAGPDAIVLSTGGNFYRLISGDPFRDTAEGEVYAIAKRVPDFRQRFSGLFGSVQF